MLLFFFQAINPRAEVKTEGDGAGWAGSGSRGKKGVGGMFPPLYPLVFVQDHDSSTVSLNRI